MKWGEKSFRERFGLATMGNDGGLRGETQQKRK